MSVLASDNRPRSRPEQRLERLYVIQPHGLTDASMSECASSHSGGMERRSLYSTRIARHEAYRPCRRVRDSFRPPCAKGRPYVDRLIPCKLHGKFLEGI